MRTAPVRICAGGAQQCASLPRSLIGEAAAEAGLSISEHVVRSSVGSGEVEEAAGLPLSVLRRVARAVPVLEDMEARRLEVQGAGEDWRRALEIADAWIDGEAGIG